MKLIDSPLQALFIKTFSLQDNNVLLKTYFNIYPKQNWPALSLTQFHKRIR